MSAFAQTLTNNGLLNFNIAAAINAGAGVVLNNFKSLNFNDFSRTGSAIVNTTGIDASAAGGNGGDFGSGGLGGIVSISGGSGTINFNDQSHADKSGNNARIGMFDGIDPNSQPFSLDAMLDYSDPTAVILVLTPNA